VYLKVICTRGNGFRRGRCVRDSEFNQVVVLFGAAGTDGASTAVAERLLLARCVLPFN